MSMNDPIADMLTRMRNAITAKQVTVDVPASRTKEEICVVLKREGFIKDYALTDAIEVPRCQLRISLKYLPDRTPVIEGLRRVSRPSMRLYKRSKELRPVRSGFGIAVISTSKGVMTGKQARLAKLGGEVLCEVW
jgi:small subunit ribosomal protein S8